MPHAHVLSAKEFKADPSAVLNQAEKTSVIITKGAKKFAVVELVDSEISEEDRQILMEANFESSLTRLIRRIRYHCF